MAGKKYIPKFYSWAVWNPEAKESPIDFLKRLKEAENQVIEHLLKKLLKRNPTVDYLEKIEINQTNSTPDERHVFFVGVEIGKMEFGFPVDGMDFTKEISIGIRFVPSKEFAKYKTV